MLSRISLRKVALKIWNFLQNILTESVWNFAKNVSKLIHCNQFQFCVQGNVARPRKLKTFKSCFNAFLTDDSLFLIWKFTIFILIIFFLYILWIKIHNFSPWQCFVLRLISSQERAKKHKLYLILKVLCYLQFWKTKISSNRIKLLLIVN